jgi:hypothetical protein
MGDCADRANRLTGVAANTYFRIYEMLFDDGAACNCWVCRGHEFNVLLLLDI